MFVWKDENKLKRGRGLPIFFKKKRCTIDAYSWSCWNGPTTAARAPPKLPKLPATARVKTNTSSDFIAWNKEFQFRHALIGWFLCVKSMVYTDNARYFIEVTITLWLTSGLSTLIQLDCIIKTSNLFGSIQSSQTGGQTYLSQAALSFNGSLDNMFEILWTCIQSIFQKMGHSRPIFVFSIQLTVNKCSI